MFQTQRKWLFLGGKAISHQTSKKHRIQADANVQEHRSGTTLKHMVTGAPL
jgi:hypothetical protein